MKNANKKTGKKVITANSKLYRSVSCPRTVSFLFNFAEYATKATKPIHRSSQISL